jgi:ADP-ribose pyrophosphatase YjhB (NUDIX family)
VARRSAIIAATKAMPGAARPTSAPQGGTYFGAMSPLMQQLNNERGYANSYGPFLPRPEQTFTDGAFGPFSPILPVPVDAPPEGADQPDPRLYEYQVGWNLPVGQPGTEGLKLADFNTLRTLANLYSVARTCIQIRKSEIRGLDWDIVPTHEAAKAYQNDHDAMRDFGERRAKAVKFFRHPDPDFFNFGSWLDTVLDEVFVYDALSLVLRPKWGKGLGRGLLGSDLDCIELISGPTIRPLVGMHGEVPRPPAPAYQQYLYGVPRSDYMTLMTQRDIDEGGLTDAEVAKFRTDQLLYLPMLRQRWTPYGMPPIERALIPVMSGLQKQGFQLDYFREGTVPAVYISPGDPNITPNQVRELQDALNAIAGDPAWHHKIIVLPPGSRVDPQRPVDLSDEFDNMVMTQVAMAFDVSPIELGVLPNVSSGGSPFAAKEMAQASKNIHERVSTKPTLKFLCSIFDDILHRVCGQDDMKFTFEGLQEEADQAAVTDLLVKQVQYGIRSVDEARGEIELPPWGEKETSEPVVFTQMGPVPFNMAVPMIQAQMQGGAQGQQQGSNKPTSTTGRGDQYGGPGRPRHNTPIPAPSTKPSGGELPPERRGNPTPAHSAAQGHTAVPSSKPGGGSPRANARASKAEMESLARHLKKGRELDTWIVQHIPGNVMAVIADDLTKGLSIDEVMDVASRLIVSDEVYELVTKGADAGPKAHIQEWPGWKTDLGLIGSYVEIIRKAFNEAEGHAGQLREEWARGRLAITESQYKDLVGDEVERVIEKTLVPLWHKAWDLGYTSAEELVTGAHEARTDDGRDAFVVTQGKHWAQHIARTGIKNAIARSEMIARTEVARAQSAAAIECYRKYGVSYKHLVVAPDDVCEKCHKDEAAGIIPLDAAFPSGNIGSPVHVNCRCMPAPAGVNVTPPQGHIGKSSTGIEDPSRVAFLLIRARNDEGKWRYLLQKRADGINNGGKWGLPGGTCHIDEHPWHTALRESQEEMGELPAGMLPRFTMIDPREDHTVHTYIVEMPAIFHPGMDGATAHEVGGWGWFKRKEVKDLDLHKAFRRTWDDIQWDTVGKKSRRQIDLNGQETIVLDDDDDEDHFAAGGGGSVPHPHDADGTQVDEPPPGSKPGSAPPRWGGAGVPPIIPRDDDSRMPYQRGRAPNGVGKAASDIWDPNPVEAEHILSLMRPNFPEKALDWVTEARWIGPVNVPWERINTASEDSWASSHGPDAMAHITEQIRTGTGHLDPSILIQRPNDDKCDIIDGHHRALARHHLGMPVRAYVGFVKKRHMQAALETHSSQIHQGADPQNKSAETPRVSTEHHPLGTEGLWHTPSKKVPETQQLPAYIQNIARALMRDEDMEESRAIATAVNAVKRWARGELDWGKRKVTPEVRSAAQRALAEWEHLRATHH